MRAAPEYSNLSVETIKSSIRRQSGNSTRGGGHNQGPGCFIRLRSCMNSSDGLLAAWEFNLHHEPGVRWRSRSLKCLR